MTKDLAGLGVDELIALNGLRSRCSAPLRCVAHDLNLPCDLCELEGQQAVACTACGKLYATPPTDPLNRPCASVTQFQTQGVIAFADEVHHALDQKAQQQAEEEERRLESERLQKLKRTRELVEAMRRHAAETKRREAKKPRRVAKKTARSAKPDDEVIRIDKAVREKGAKALARAEEARGRRMARFSILTAVPSAVMGAMMLWDRPLIEIPVTSPWVMACYLFFGTLTWLAGISPLLGRKEAHRSLRWWAPAAWALVAFPWPGMGGLVACVTAAKILEAGLGWFALIILVVGVVTWRLCNTLMVHVATFLSMREPWPAPVKARLMSKPQRLWLGFILTGLLTVIIFHGSMPWETPSLPFATSQRPDSPSTPLPLSNVGKPLTQTLSQATPAETKAGNTHQPVTTNELDALAPDGGYYAAAIQTRILDRWVRPPTSQSNPACTVEVRLLPSGDVIEGSVRIIKPSGDQAYDRSAIVAVYQASPLPVPGGESFKQFSKFRFTFKAN
jgi:TonB family protein